MKKTIIPSIIAMMITVPSLGAVIDNTNCDSGTLQTTSGDATLRAKFDANTINIKYYNGDTEITSTVNNNAKSCTYDAGITLPSTNPSKTGYTFNGWKVKAPPAQCNLSVLDTSINGISYAYKRASNYCYYYNAATDDYRSECSDSVFSDLNVGDWKAGFSYGLIKGTTKCSSTPGTQYQTGTPSDTDGRYCWCSVTNYTPNGGETCSAVSRWVFLRDSASVCASNCANDCGYRAQFYEAMRVGLFGQN